MIIVDLISGFDMTKLVNEIILENLRVSYGGSIPTQTANANEAIGFHAMRFFFAQMQEQIWVSYNTVIMIFTCLGEDSEGFIQMFRGVFIKCLKRRDRLGNIIVTIEFLKKCRLISDVI